MNKKGALTDIFLYIIVAFILVLVSGMFLYMARTVKEEFNENGLIDSQIVNDSLGDLVASYDALKWITYFLLIGMILAIFINSFLVQTHPVFFVIYIFLTVIAVIVAVPVSNTYEEIYNNEVIGATFHEFGATSWIMLHLPTWIAVIGMIGAILLFSSMMKSQGGFL